MSRSKTMNHLTHLKEEIKVLESRIEPHDTGHIITAIGVLRERVEEIQKELDDQMKELEDETDFEEGDGGELFE